MFYYCFAEEAQAVLLLLVLSVQHGGLLAKAVEERGIAVLQDPASNNVRKPLEDEQKADLLYLAAHWVTGAPWLKLEPSQRLVCAFRPSPQDLVCDVQLPLQQLSQQQACW